MRCQGCTDDYPAVDLKDGLCPECRGATDDEISEFDKTEAIMAAIDDSPFNEAT
jgi:hypothetical protein